MTNQPSLILRGNTVVHIDWANVYGWKNSRHSNEISQFINPNSLFKYLSYYPQIKNIHFYFGLDNHKKSAKFLSNAKKIGYTIHSKPVKHIITSKNPFKTKRKCDFDVEICLQTLSEINKFGTFVFFSGDGDFAPLYKKLSDANKKVIVVYARHHLGKELWQLPTVFKIEIGKIAKNNSLLLARSKDYQ